MTLTDLTFDDWRAFGLPAARRIATEFVYGEDGEDMYEEFTTRPVLAL
ncbi:hypothetical protein ABT095_26505 [Kitasatospora sp. NPDC002227]